MWVVQENSNYDWTGDTLKEIAQSIAEYCVRNDKGLPEIEDLYHCENDRSFPKVIPSFIKEMEKRAEKYEDVFEYEQRMEKEEEQYIADVQSYYNATRL